MISNRVILDTKNRIAKIRKKESDFFLNTKLIPFGEKLMCQAFNTKDIQRVENLMQRFAPLLAQLFPELESTAGIIESPLVEMRKEPKSLSPRCQKGNFWLKCDHTLPVAGSIKARGGIYEVLVHAENLAINLGLLKESDDYSVFNTPAIKKVLGQYTVAVGSTGNLGLSIGVMASALGFNTCVHMSSEAKEWKKERLRKCGVTVVEHKSDYCGAVQAGRDMALRDDKVYFVDDENSEQLFLGYSVSAIRLGKQLSENGIKVDDDHPLFVYLPCGVGGAPGGITFGLKQYFGDNVHCFFAEPIEAPCMTLAMLHNFEDFPSVDKFGLMINTEADGLAVGKASRLVGSLIAEILSGCYTVTDEDLLLGLYDLKNEEGISVEPSAAAGYLGPRMLCGAEEGILYLQQNNLLDNMKNANHIIWTTGGVFVPEKEYASFYEQARIIAANKCHYDDNERFGLILQKQL
ncbi:D-serine ammonia-lyase [Desulforhopalus singaporensis]|uniref:Probable D-serine dehydratase n=1 Tax=Desulforhopalus singaporensis TaxID=91360 RepID=A0A1H0VVU7_9BACT|nr:D-serine ammonia-lyase [Desulforhopalus singaporensis]SDP82580.1 D-serine ammonia-lyase [Desulforhopalus singaporensis]